jgi:shikimate 5-dehydrogenase
MDEKEFEITSDMLYRCYSSNLMKYCTNQGCTYLLPAIDIVSGKTFWLFQKTKKFKQCLEIWKANSPKNKKS